MRAVLLESYGPPERLRIAEVPEPEPGPRDLLIAVRASSINPIDWKIRRGIQRGLIRYRLPWIQGLDVSGVVLQVGEAVAGFSVGDEVFASPTWRRPGCWAERVAVAAAQVAHKPVRSSHEEAASIPLVGLTAWACLLPKLAERPGQRVFIQAGSGGVGTFAIQLAKYHGAWVATTCSDRNTALVTGLGADRVIDYRSQRFEDVLAESGGPVDIVLDALGGEQRQRAFAVLKRGGRLASIVSGMPENAARYGPNLGALVTLGASLRFGIEGLLRGVRAASVLRPSDGAILAQIAELLESGAIRPVIDRCYPMEQIVEAHRYMETGRARGKVVLRGFVDQ